jgi:serine/threonine-protein phosphatase 2A regulatory subunit A
LLSQSLLPAIIDLAEDSKWRIRLAIIDHIPALAAQLGTTFFNDKLNSISLGWLSDDVYTVRRASTENLKKLTLLFGEDWAKEQLLPRIDRMHVHTNYLQRMTALYGVQVLVSSMSFEVIENLLVPIVMQMTKDSVPNVRFTSIKTIEAILKHIKTNDILTEMIKSLSYLASDTDRDVKYFALKVTIHDINLPHAKFLSLYRH